MNQSGLNENMFSKCTYCNATTTFQTTSKSGTQSEVNVRLVHAGLVTGCGLSNLFKLCGIMNLPKFLTKKNYNNTLKNIEEKGHTETKKAMQRAVSELKSILQGDGDETDSDDCFHCSVTLDGTWQKRYGYNSLHGVVFLMSVTTGEFIDYVVKTKFCFECKSKAGLDKSSKAFKD